MCLKFLKMLVYYFKRKQLSKAFFQSQLQLIIWLKLDRFNSWSQYKKESLDIHMPHVNTKLFLNGLFVCFLRSWSVFWVKIQTTTISHWQIKNTKNLGKQKGINVNQLRPSIQARHKISYKRCPSGPIPLTQQNLEEFWEKEKRKETKPKQNWRLLKNLFQGQLSMECILVFRLPTHAEHQKLGLSLSLFSQAQATVELLGLYWIVTHSASVGRINTNTHWSNRRGYPFYLTFIFLNYTLKHLSLVQLSKSAVQCAT